MLEIAAETDMCELQVDQTLVDTDSSVVVV